MTNDKDGTQGADMTNVREFAGQLVQAQAIISKHRPLLRNSDLHAADCMRDLLQACLLAGNAPREDPRGDVVHVLQARMPWSTAEAIAAELDETGLLAATR